MNSRSELCDWRSIRFGKTTLNHDLKPRCELAMISRAKKKRQVRRTYLVSIATAWNDIPVRIFTSLASARRFAESLDMNQALQELGLEELMGGEIGDPVAVAIFAFRDQKIFRRESVFPSAQATADA